MSAMMDAPCFAFDSTWYSDSGITNHITPDAHNPTTKLNYARNDQIHVCDGTSLDIHHIGSSSFQSEFNSEVLFLKHLLHVPFITKNLCSVSKFAVDNEVFFGFLPNYCFVKDHVSDKFLMVWKLKDELYMFDPPQL